MKKKREAKRKIKEKSKKNYLQEQMAKNAEDFKIVDNILKISPINYNEKPNNENRIEIYNNKFDLFNLNANDIFFNKELDEILLNNNEDDLNKKFSSEFPELDLNKCEITGNFLNGTNFNFTETLDEDVIKAIIFSMNKIIKSESKNDNKNQKIFEKIYSFMEKKTIQKIMIKNKRKKTTMMKKMNDLNQ